MFIQQTMAAMRISCTSFLLVDGSTISCSSGHSAKEARHRIGTSSFEKKITSREDILTTETEDAWKEIYNFMGIGEQIPFMSSKDLPH